MNGPNAPLTAETLDELLSADLDGELDQAAADLGLSPEAARAAIATPAAVARRAALAAASELVATRVPLSSDDTDRLVAIAVADAAKADELEIARRRRRRADTARRVLVAAGSAAAVIVVIVALASTRPGSDAKSSSAASSGESNAAPPKAAHGPVAFGDVTDLDTLRARVRANLPAPPEFSAGTTGKTSGPTRTADSAISPNAVTSSTAQKEQLKRPIGTGCLARLRSATGIEAPAVLSGRGVVHGQPVSVVVFPLERGYDVFVLGTKNCAVVSHTHVP